jgi:hypothetical protein
MIGPVQSQQPEAPADPAPEGSSRVPLRIGAGELSPWLVVSITTAFWLYVTLSDLLYAEGMRADLAQYTSAPVFADGWHRILQHLLLFPFLLAAYWVSGRIGWTPAARRVPLQTVLAAAFAVLPFWLMWGSSLLRSAVGGVPLEPIETLALQSKGDQGVWLASTVSGFSTYCFGLVLLTGAGVFRHFHALRLRNTELQRDWANARLAALRMQLSPHALFNLLHTIQAQIRPHPDTAESMVSDFAALLRRLLHAGEQDLSLLADELRFIELYLGLQAQRFSDRLVIHLPQYRTQPRVWVPSLILQPLIENAIVHGLAEHRGAVHIRLTIEPRANELRIEVTNSVAPGKQVAAEGVGLRNVRERLAVQFGESASLRAGMRDAGSWSAEVRLPMLRDWTPSGAAAAT